MKNVGIGDNRLFAPAEVPDGWYDGKWSGYEVTFLCGNKEVMAKTELGVRGINIPVRVQCVSGCVAKIERVNQ